MASTTTSHKRTASSPPAAPNASQPKISKFFEKKAQKDGPPVSKKPQDDTTIESAESRKDITPNATTASTPAASTSKVSSTPSTLRLTYHTGDIFAAPPHSLLIHACNTQGSWGAGIAAAFRQRYPQAYKRYRDHCVSSHSPSTNAVPTGSCLLIPPCETDPKKRKHWIGCLFTSAKYGKSKDGPAVILGNTGPAMKELLQQFKEANVEDGGAAGVRMCKINSARFGVPWERTVAVLEGIEVEEGWAGDIEVWSIE